MQEYSLEFLHIYQLVGRGLPKSLVASTLKPEAVGLKSRADFFQPIRFDIKVAHSDAASRGFLRVQVPVRENARWFGELKERLAKTMSLPSVAAQSMDVLDMCNRSIEKMGAEQLARVGPLKVLYHGGVKRLSAMPQAPAEYSTRKLDSISSWLEGVCVKIPEMVAGMLATQTAAGVSEACRPGGPVQKAVEEHIESKTKELTGRSWPEFVRVHATNSPASVSSESARHVLDQVSESVLASLHTHLRASAKRLQDYSAAMQAKRLASRVPEDAGRRRELFQPLFQSELANNNVSLESGHKMYRSIAQHAMRNPCMRRDIGTLLYRQTFDKVACPNKSKEKKDDNYDYYHDTVYEAGDYKRKKRQGTEILVLRGKHHHHHRAWAHDHKHPYWSMVHGMSRPVYGVTPAYYTVYGTRQNLTEGAPYAGDEVSTWQTYHALMGLPLCPPAIKLSARTPAVAKKEQAPSVKAPRVIPINCKKEEKVEDEDAEKMLETCLAASLELAAAKPGDHYVTRAAQKVLECCQQAVSVANGLSKSAQVLLQEATAAPLISFDGKFVASKHLPQMNRQSVQQAASMNALFVKAVASAAKNMASEVEEIGRRMRHISRSKKHEYSTLAASLDRAPPVRPLAAIQTKAPKLVPIDDRVGKAPRVVPISRAPKLVPITPMVGLPVASDEDEDEWVDDMPTLGDLMSKK